MYSDKNQWFSKCSYCVANYYFLKLYYCCHAADPCICERERKGGGVMNRIIFKEYFYLDEYAKIKSKSFKFKNFNLQNVLFPPSRPALCYVLQIEKNYQNNTYTNTRHTVNRTNSI